MEDYKAIREIMKIMVKEEVKNFVDMINDVDDPPALDYQIKANSIRVRIVVDLDT